MYVPKGGPHDRDASPDGRRVEAARLQPAHEHGVPRLDDTVRSALRRPPEQLGNEEVRAFLVTLLTEGKLSRSTLVQAFCALKFFYVHVLHRSFEIESIRFPRKRGKLPRVLSGSEVRRLLEAAPELKEQTILMTLYSTGLRLRELTHLQIKDIDSNKMQIRVRQGKGSKDRISTSSSLCRRSSTSWPWATPR